MLAGRVSDHGIGAYAQVLDQRVERLVGAKHCFRAGVHVVEAVLTGRTQRRRKNDIARQIIARVIDRKSVVEGKSVDLGGRRIIKKIDCMSFGVWTDQRLCAAASSIAKSKPNTH